MTVLPKRRVGKTKLEAKKAFRVAVPLDAKIAGGKATTTAPMTRMLVMEGVLAIQAGSNPRVIAQKLWMGQPS